MTGIERDAGLPDELVSAEWRDVGDDPLDQLEQSVLDALPHVLRAVDPPTAELIHLAEVNDPALGGPNVHVGGDPEFVQDRLHVLADVTRLCQRRGIGDGEGQAQTFGQSLGKERLSAAAGADQEDVGFLDRDVAQRDIRNDRCVGVPVYDIQEPHKLVRDGDGQSSFRPILADDRVVQVLDDLSWSGEEALARLNRVRNRVHGERHRRDYSDRRPHRATDCVPVGVSRCDTCEDLRLVAVG